jgi:hypothetical protein
MLDPADLAALLEAIDRLPDEALDRLAAKVEARIAARAKRAPSPPYGPLGGRAAPIEIPKEGWPP